MSSIPEWYKGRSILVTGATGFMGKVLVEKLVRSLADIDKIYLLLRPRYGLSANSRIEKLVKLPVNVLYFMAVRNIATFCPDCSTGVQ